MPQTLKTFGKNFKENTFSSLKIRNYRLFFIGQLVSLSGTWMQTIAQGWLVLTVTGSGTQVGIVVALEFIPLLFLGPWGGLIADRYSKRKILILVQIFSALIAGIVGILVLLDAIQIWMLYTSASLIGIIRLFEAPTRQSFIFELVGDTQIKNAVTLGATSNNLARAVGPSIAGILIAGVGIAFCFLFNAFSFLAVLVMLFFMRSSEMHRVKQSEKKAGQIREGLRYVMATPRIRNTLIMSALIGTFVYEFQVSLPILAKYTYLGTAASYASLMTAFGIGAVIGGLFAAGRKRVSSRDYLVFMGCLALSITITALMPTLEWAVIGMFVVGFFGINTNSLGNTIIQLEAKPEMRGRVMALWSMAMMGSTPIGAPIVGYVGTHLGGRYALGLGALSAFIACGFGIFARRKKQKLERMHVTEKIELNNDKIESESTKLP